MIDTTFTSLKYVEVCTLSHGAFFGAPFFSLYYDNLRVRQMQAQLVNAGTPSSLTHFTNRIFPPFKQLG